MNEFLYSERVFRGIDEENPLETLFFNYNDEQIVGSRGTNSLISRTFKQLRKENILMTFKDKENLYIKDLTSGED